MTSAELANTLMMIVDTFTLPGAEESLTASDRNDAIQAGYKLLDVASRVKPLDDMDIEDFEERRNFKLECLRSILDGEPFDDVEERFMANVRARRGETE